MAEYNFKEIEKKWQAYWKEKATFKTEIDTSKAKFYALDMFPYPSGAGLHVGHPLGYIASDIVSRYKRNKGFNVLHPMGFDAFGLPAEQYAIQTGQHPALTTQKNIKRYKEQLENIGFSFDWSREVQTCDPSYYKWTQWIFCQLFESWYDHEAQKARPIQDLIDRLEKKGNQGIKAACDDPTPSITAEDWSSWSPERQQRFLLHYRLAFLSDTTVNWCPELGTVLSNEEVKDGYSERGGHPVERKKMQQWSLRITAYSERLLTDLQDVDWPEPVKEMQRNWIGKSIGAQFYFTVEGSGEPIPVFTTRVDTIFGVTYLAIAPESDWAKNLVHPKQKAAVEEYVATAKNRSERDRMSDTKTISGVFTGTYAVNPFNEEKVPIWVADYVLAGYGTGAVMAVPAHDTRDYAFAKHFNLPIREVVEGGNIEEEAYDAKEGTVINSGFLNGLNVQEAILKAVAFLEENKLGSGKINYRMRDAIFSRQRYWGEPFPVYFKGDIPYLIPEEELPLVLPEVNAYKPTESGEPPLGRAENWKTKEGYPYEMSTMPGWAGSSWYLFRYMDAHNPKELASKEALNYWKNVDLYIGGSEHATGHLMYARFWTKFLYDIGVVPVHEPFQKMINQGMIQGRSSFAYRVNGKNTFVSFHLSKNYDCSPMHVDISLVNANDELDVEAFKNWRPDLKEAEFILENGKFICSSEVEKMSKSKFNVVNPDDVIEKYGADTLRLYEMFLGPLEQFKPWNTHGIDGVAKFLKKFWRLFYDESGEWIVEAGAAKAESLKAVHKTLKKVEEDIQSLSLNTSVSQFMICVNELSALKEHARKALEPLVIALSSFAPHITEELWQKLGHEGSISLAEYPAVNETYLQEDSFEYPVSVNGKLRAKMTFGLDMPKEDIEREVLSSAQIQKYTKGEKPKKVIIVHKKIVNVVV